MLNHDNKQLLAVSIYLPYYTFIVSLEWTISTYKKYFDIKQYTLEATPYIS